MRKAAWALVVGLGSAGALASEPGPVGPEEQAEAEPAPREEAGEAEPATAPSEEAGAAAEPSAAPAASEPAGPEPAEAAPTRAKATTIFSNDLEMRYWQMPQRLAGFEDRPVLDYFEQVNRFTATVRLGPWSIYGQLDQVALTANSYFLNDVRTPERDLLQVGAWSPLIPGRFDPSTQGMAGWDLISRNLYINLEKLRIGYEKGKFSLTIGDAYVSLGRGLAININRNVDIDIDTSLQGVRALWRPGMWELQAFLGQVNRQQVFQDNPNRGIFGDRRHTVGGLRIDRFGLGPVNLGAHGVVYNFTTVEGWKAGFEELKKAPDAVVAGANVEAFGLGPTDWYLEGNVYAFPTNDLWGGNEARPGYSLYLSSSIFAGPATILVEGKRYYQAERLNRLLGPEAYEIAVPPALEYERAITQDSAEAVNSNDAWGVRARADFAAIPGVLTPYLSLAVFRDDDLEIHYNPVPETIVHPVVGLEVTKDDWAVFLNGGYRVDVRDGTGFGADRQLHADVLAKLPLAKGWLLDLSVGAEWFRWGNNGALQLSDYTEMETALSVQYGSLFTFVWYTDYSDNPLIDSVGNLSPVMYGAGEIQVKPLPALTLKAFYGAYKSGIRCSGGQCRILPGFEGARLSLTANF
jgi:hypothetical protein